MIASTGMQKVQIHIFEAVGFDKTILLMMTVETLIGENSLGSGFPRLVFGPRERTVRRNLSLLILQKFGRRHGAAFNLFLALGPAFVVEAD